jgi:hypothetical protein
MIPELQIFFLGHVLLGLFESYSVTFQLKQFLVIFDLLDLFMSGNLLLFLFNQVVQLLKVIGSLLLVSLFVDMRFE